MHEAGDDRFLFLTEGRSIRLPTPPQMHNHGNYVISLGNLCRWLAEQAEAPVGGVTAVHQFVRIGCHSFVGGGSRLPQDVAPYVMAAGSPCAAYGLNIVGLRRRGFKRETIRQIKDAYRLIFQSEMNVSQALDQIMAREDLMPEVEHMVSFIRSSDRGITT